MKKPNKKALVWLLGLIVLLLNGCDSANGVKQNSVKQEKPLASTAVTLAESKVKGLNKSGLPEVVMYKSPNCECCTGWAEHLGKEGFSVVEYKRDDMDAIKSKYGVTEKLASCHTAIVDGYVIEGHVPAADIERLLKERPNVVGLTAPGMPMKSPGMQQPGQAPKGYDVLAFDADGKSRIFTHY